MTPTEALLAMKIGCRIMPADRREHDAYYFIEGNWVVYFHTALELSSKVGTCEDFPSEYREMEWKLYDDPPSPISNEDRM